MTNLTDARVSSAAGKGAKAGAVISVCFMTDTFNIFREIGKLTQDASNGFQATPLSA